MTLLWLTVHIVNPRLNCWPRSGCPVWRRYSGVSLLFDWSVAWFVIWSVGLYKQIFLLEFHEGFTGINYNVSSFTWQILFHHPIQQGWFVTILDFYHAGDKAEWGYLLHPVIELLYLTYIHLFQTLRSARESKGRQQHQMRNPRRKRRKRRRNQNQKTRKRRKKRKNLKRKMRIRNQKVIYTAKCSLRNDCGLWTWYEEWTCGLWCFSWFLSPHAVLCCRYYCRIGNFRNDLKKIYSVFFASAWHISNTNVKSCIILNLIIMAKNECTKKANLKFQRHLRQHGTRNSDFTVNCLQIWAMLLFFLGQFDSRDLTLIWSVWSKTLWPIVTVVNTPWPSGDGCVIWWMLLKA